MGKLLGVDTRARGINEKTARDREEREGHKFANAE